MYFPSPYSNNNNGFASHQYQQHQQQQKTTNKDGNQFYLQNQRERNNNKNVINYNQKQHHIEGEEMEFLPINDDDFGNEMHFEYGEREEDGEVIGHYESMLLSKPMDYGRQNSNVPLENRQFTSFNHRNNNFSTGNGHLPFPFPHEAEDFHNHHSHFYESGRNSVPVNLMMERQKYRSATIPKPIQRTIFEDRQTKPFNNASFPNLPFSFPVDFSASLPSNSNMLANTMSNGHQSSTILSKTAATAGSGQKRPNQKQQLPLSLPLPLSPSSTLYFDSRPPNIGFSKEQLSPAPLMGENGNRGNGRRKEGVWPTQCPPTQLAEGKTRKTKATTAGAKTIDDVPPPNEARSGGLDVRQQQQQQEWWQADQRRSGGREGTAASGGRGEQTPGTAATAVYRFDQRQPAASGGSTIFISGSRKSGDGDDGNDGHRNQQQQQSFFSPPFVSAASGNQQQTQQRAQTSRYNNNSFHGAKQPFKIETFNHHRQQPHLHWQKDQSANFQKQYLHDIEPVNYSDQFERKKSDSSALANTSFGNSWHQQPQATTIRIGGGGAVGAAAEGNQQQQKKLTSSPSINIPNNGESTTEQTDLAHQSKLNTAGTAVVDTAEAANCGSGDPDISDLLLAYNNIADNNQSSILNRSRTLPVIKFNYCQPKKTSAKEEFERTKAKALSPLTSSQNLLEAAINSLDDQQQHQKERVDIENWQISQLAAPGREQGRNSIVSQKKNHQTVPLHIRNPFLQSFSLEQEEFVRQPQQRELKLKKGEEEFEEDQQSQELFRLFKELGLDISQQSSKKGNIDNNNTIAKQQETKEEEMAKTTKNWKSSFTEMRDRFGGGNNATGRKEDFTPSLFQFSTNGGQATPEGRRQSFPQQWQKQSHNGNNNTMPRTAGRAGSVASAAETDNYNFKQGNKNATVAEESAKQAHQNKQQQKGPDKLSNFWLMTLKNRAEASSSSSAAQRLPLGLTAAERLHQLQEPIDLALESRQSPCSSSSAITSSSSPITTPNSVQQQQNGAAQKYPYRKASSGVESVAIRRTNYLMEAGRAHSPSSFVNNGGPSSGRSTPLLRTLKSPSPDIIEEKNYQFSEMGKMNVNSNDKIKQKQQKGCAPFPTGQENESKDREKSRSPTDSTKFLHQQNSISTRPGLPQPAPKHNIRDQLLSAGYRQKQQFVPGSSSSTSFFGGFANNPFQASTEGAGIIGQNSLQQQLLRSNAPNFPSTNTVTARISQIEKQQQQQQKVTSSSEGGGSAAQLGPQGNFYHPSLITKTARQKATAATNSSHNRNSTSSPFLTVPGPIGAQNGATIGSSGAGQLSPKSTVYRTKPVIVFDFDQKTTLEEENGNREKEHQLQKPQQQQQKRKGSSPTGGAKKKTTTENGATASEKQQQQQQNKKVGQLQLSNFIAQKKSKTDGNGSPGRAEEEDRSPRWRNDENGEALLARKREQHKRDSSPSAHQHSSRLDNQQNGYQNQYNQKQQSLAGRTTNQIQQQNGYIPNGAEAKLQLQQKETKPSSVSAVIWERSSAAECVFSPLVKLALPGSREKETENEEHQNKPDSHLVEPPSYQQAAADSFESTLATAIKLSRISGKLAGMPKFHFPLGRPVTKAENDQRLSRIRELFEGKPRGQLHLANFGELCQRIDFPIYTKRAVYDACCQLNGLPLMPALATVEGGTEGPEPAEGQPVDFNQFCVYWNRMISEAHDEAARFVFTLSASAGRVSAGKQSHCPFLLKEDFLPMLMDLILTHPGLHFLKEAPQFYSKYCEVVIIRIFWNINRSWTGKINASELRRSNFLQTLRVLDDVGDINKVTEYFSYEHFYVTYCKFWELDTDHDMVISREDMRRHCNGALTDRIIDRIFSAAVIRTPSEQRIISKPGPVRTQQPIETIGFEDFVAFLLAEEDKRHPTSIEYWFRCVDLDGDGQISLFEMEYFYHAIEQKLLSKNMETLALRDVICNLLDSISPENGFAVSRTDLKRSGLSHRFFNTFVNWIKYVDQESSDGERAAVKTTGDKEISDWEVFCLTEYELLMSETEQMSNEGDVEENIDVILDDEEEEQQLMSGGTGVTAATSGSLSPSLGAIDGEQRLNGFLQQKQNAVVSKAM